MKALILNSGVGHRMGTLTATQPKCMTELVNGQTILSRQIAQLEEQGIREIAITTGPFVEALEVHARQSAKIASLTFVNNPDYNETNYIYSVYLARNYLQDDILSLHGDLVLSSDVLADILSTKGSQMTVSSTAPIPEKDFKAVISNGLIQAVGVEFFENVMAAQPLYKLEKNDWLLWLHEMARFIESGQKTCYGENALNVLDGRCNIFPFDVRDRFCMEVDTPEDLALANRLLIL